MNIATNSGNLEAKSLQVRLALYEDQQHAVRHRSAEWLALSQAHAAAHTVLPGYRPSPTVPVLGRFDLYFRAR